MDSIDINRPHGRNFDGLLFIRPYISRAGMLHIAPSSRVLAPNHPNSTLTKYTLDLDIVLYVPDDSLEPTYEAPTEFVARFCCIQICLLNALNGGTSFNIRGSGRGLRM